MLEPTVTIDSAQRVIYSVSRLNQEARQLLEGVFPLLWVEGEISNLSRPSSGHLYFTLKDSQAQVRCALFKGKAMYLRSRPKDGDQVLIRARVSLYPARGDYQLLVEHLEPAGDGALQRAFDALKQRLQAEGLFAAERKRPLPAVPRRVGVITSPTGAAIHDVLTVLKRRCPSLQVLIYPVPVQGAGAAAQIADAIRLASARREVDVLLLTRGGGSLEDLWSFNEEVVARAIAACELPLVAAVGHEVDVTIADFVADQRAPTPSAAAELISPDAQLWRQQVEQKAQRLRHSLSQQLRRRQERLQWLDRSLAQQFPLRRLHERGQRVDELELRLGAALQRMLRQAVQRHAQLAARMRLCSPRERVGTLQRQQDELRHRLLISIEHHLRQQGSRLGGLARQLDAVSPLATLNRGYAIVRTDGGELLRSARQAEPGDAIVAQLAEGALHCRVEKVDPSC